MINVITTWRQSVLDAWAEAERALITAATILGTAEPSERSAAWNAVKTQKTRTLIEAVRALLVDNGHRPVGSFVVRLNELYDLRNLLAHHAARPLPSPGPEGAQFAKVTGFRQVSYVTVRFTEMERVVKRAEEVMHWLIEAIPDADGFSVQFEEDAVTYLKRSIPIQNQ